MSNTEGEMNTVNRIRQARRMKNNEKKMPKKNSSPRPGIFRENPPASETSVPHLCFAARILLV
jgi:hypothetical protein